MSTLNPAETACGNVQRILDSYVSGEAEGAGGVEVRRHLEGCHACDALASARERVRALVRRAVRGEAAPESLRAKVREMIRRDAR
jgi:anti-sigma factor (TIGR02949 family)